MGLTRENKIVIIFYLCLFIVLVSWSALSNPHNEEYFSPLQRDYISLASEVKQATALEQIAHELKLIREHMEKCKCKEE